MSFGRAKQELESAVQQAQTALNGNKAARGMKRKRDDDVDESKLNSRERRKRKRDEERKVRRECVCAGSVFAPGVFLTTSNAV